MTSLQLSQSIRPKPLGASLEQSLTIKPPTLITNPSTVSQEPSLIPLNQMGTDNNIPGNQLGQSQAAVMSLLQNSKTPAPVINEKTQRCAEFKQGKYGNIPVCFKENSPKEELVLEHVIQYKRQFQLVYESEGRELFINPKNECDVYKVYLFIINPVILIYTTKVHLYHRPTY